MFVKEISAMLKNRGYNVEVVDDVTVKGKDAEGDVQISVEIGLNTIIVNNKIGNRFLKSYCQDLAELSLYLDI